MTHPRSGFDPAASSLAGGVAPEVMAELLSVRSSIDNIDATLVYLLAERFKATQRVGHLKAEHDLPAGDPQREAAQIARLRMLAEEAQLDPAFAEKFLNFIISEVIRHHQAISENRRPGSDPTRRTGTAEAHPAASDPAGQGGSADPAASDPAGQGVSVDPGELRA